MKIVKKILAIKNLTLNFNTPKGTEEVLNGVNLDVYYNSILGLVGESGCGKTVTALSVLKLIPSAEIVNGEIWFKGENLLLKPEKEMRKIRGKEISMVFQEPSTSLNPVMTVGDQIAEVFKLHMGLSEKDAMKEVIKVLQRLQFPEASNAVNKYPFQLSGGMQQRVMTAMALACSPKLLILDEPTTSLDVTIQAQVLELIDRLVEDGKKSALFITHNFAIVAEICDRVAVMYSGNVVECGNVETIYEAPTHPYTIGLLQSVPKIHKRVERLKAIPGSVPDLLNPPPGCRFHPRCPYAKDICRKEKPELVNVGNEHQVSCHLRT